MKYFGRININIVIM